jgi:hypothetical protein
MATTNASRGSAARAGEGALITERRAVYTPDRVAGKRLNDNSFVMVDHGSSYPLSRPELLEEAAQHMKHLLRETPHTVTMIDLEALGLTVGRAERR